MSGDETAKPRRSWLDRMWTSERGQGIVEYVLIVSVVGLGAIVALGFVSGKIQQLFFKSGNKLELTSHGDSSKPPNGLREISPFPTSASGTGRTSTTRTTGPTPCTARAP